MIRIYYHVYGIDNVDEIVHEQLSLLGNIIEPYTLTIGLSLSDSSYDHTPLLDIINPKIIKIKDNEFLTLNLIEEDDISDDDYILYIHTKGASKIKTSHYEKDYNWRLTMNHYLIKQYKNVLKILKDYNTFGYQLEGLDNGIDIYSGNFWWTTGKYIKTINTENVDKSNRYNAELNFIQLGRNWKPYYIKRKLPKNKMSLI